MSESVFFSDSGRKISVDHEMENVVYYTDQKGGAIFREAGDLDHDRQGKGFLGPHEKNRFPSSLADIKETGQPETYAKEYQVEYHHQRENFSNGGAFCNQNLPGP